MKKIALFIMTLAALFAIDLRAEVVYSGEHNVAS